MNIFKRILVSAWVAVCRFYDTHYCELCGHEVPAVDVAQAKGSRDFVVCGMCRRRP